MAVLSEHALPKPSAVIAHKGKQAACVHVMKLSHASRQSICSYVFYKFGGQGPWTLAIIEPSEGNPEGKFACTVCDSWLSLGHGKPYKASPNPMIGLNKLRQHAASIKHLFNMQVNYAPLTHTQCLLVHMLRALRLCSIPISPKYPPYLGL